MTLKKCETSYGARHGECAVWLNEDTLCDRPEGHLAGDLPHRGHAPSPPFDRWIEFDDDGVEIRRGGSWPVGEPE